MLYLTSEEIGERWDTVPKSLREEICSDVNADFIWKTCETEHLPEEKRYDVARAVGYVLLGFLHPGDLAEEFAEAVQTNKQTADTIANAINARIFVPVEEELNKVYEPPSKFAPPVPVEEIKPGESKWFSGAAARAGAAPPAVSRVEPPPPPKTAGEGPVGRSIPLGEFARIGKVSPLQVFGGKSAAVSGVKPAEPSKGALPSPVKSAESPPMMLHEEVPLKTAPEASSFKIEIPTPKLSEVKTEKEAAMPKPAIIDFGKPPMPPSPKKQMEDATRNVAQEQKPARIVHYTEFRTPLDVTRGKPLDTVQGGPLGEVQSKPINEIRSKPAVSVPPSKPLGEISVQAAKPMPVEQTSKPPERPAMSPPIPVPSNINKGEIVAPKIFGTQTPPNIPLMEKPRASGDKGEFAKLATEKKPEMPLSPPKRAELPPIKQP